MSLDVYWPVEKEINKCINPLAEAVSEAVLLAVHQPTPMSYILAGSLERISTSEVDLLKYFNTKDVPTGVLLVSITGASGAGKSHLIRWLHACMSQSADFDHYLNIYIPKSASLRKVVELIIEHLPEDPKYFQVKQEFQKAISDINPEDAAIRFGASLEIELSKLASELREKIRIDSKDMRLRQQFDHATKLPKFLSDSVTVDYFREKVFQRITQRPVSGLGSYDEDTLQSQFKPQDLDLPDSVEVSKAAQLVERYYKTILQSHGGSGKELAVEVLNKVVDKATRDLFKLNESLGGMTLQDVILEIRRLLLKENKQLAIYVEDFAALTGIQETLLNVLIQEGVQGGEQKYATMRSAIAVTDGYLASRETIQTRAKREWIVESHLSTEQEVVDRVKCLVASYVNAARLGEDKLKSLYTKVDHNIWSKGGDWTPIFEADELDEKDDLLLKSFGYKNGIPLFPYNDYAIETLAYHYLKHGDSIILNPRFVIDRLLNDLLLPGRSSFLAKQFPDLGFQAFQASARIAEWLHNLALTDQDRNRYQKVIVVWGNQPQFVEEIGRIPSQVFEAFGLQAPETFGIQPVLQPPTEKIVKTGPISVEKDPNNEKVQKLFNELEDWIRTGTMLSSVTANSIRHSLARAINDRMDYNADRTVKIEIPQRKFFIHNSKGQGNINEDDSFRVVDDKIDSSGKLRSELISLLRFYSLYNEDMNYSEVDDDLARIGNMTERMMPQVEAFLNEVASKNVRSAIIALSLTSRILGLYRSGTNPLTVKHTLLDQYDQNFINSVNSDTAVPFKEWIELQHLCLEVRPLLIELLVNYCGCFQGTGTKVLGLDFVRIIQNYPKNVFNYEPTDLEPLPADVKAKVTRLSDLRVKSKVTAILTELKKIRVLLSTNLGEDFDKNVVVESLKNLTNAAKDIGVWPDTETGISSGEFKKLCEEFRSGSVKDSVQYLDRALQHEAVDDLNKMIKNLGQLSLGPLLTTNRFLLKARTVLEKIDKQVYLQENKYEGIDPKFHATKITKLFTEIEDNLKQLQGSAK